MSPRSSCCSLSRSPDVEMCTRQRGGVASAGAGIHSGGASEGRHETGMFAVEALELVGPRSDGSVPPTSGSCCRPRYQSNSCLQTPRASHNSPEQSGGANPKTEDESRRGDPAFISTERRRLDSSRAGITSGGYGTFQGVCARKANDNCRDRNK